MILADQLGNLIDRDSLAGQMLRAHYFPDIQAAQVCNSVYGQVCKRADPDRVVRQNDCTCDAPNRASACEKFLQTIRSIVDLCARPPAPPVRDWNCTLDQVSELIVLVSPPPITVAGNSSIDEFDFHSKNAQWPHQDFVNFSARVVISIHLTIDGQATQ